MCSRREYFDMMQAGGGRWYFGGALEADAYQEAADG